MFPTPRFSTLQWLVLAGLLAAALLSEQSLWLWRHLTQGPGGDFYVFYNVAQRAWNAQAIYHTDEAQRYLSGAVPYYAPYLYAPHYLLVVRPLQGLDPWVAEVLWQGFHALVLVGVLLSAPVRRLAAQMVPEADAWVRAALVLLMPAMLYAQLVGHPALSAAGLLLLAVALLPTRPVVAGMVFAVLAYKPQLVLLVPLLLIAGRYWQALVAFVLMLALLAMLGTLMLGPDTWALYGEALLRHAEMMRSKHGAQLLHQFVSVFASLLRAGLPESAAIVGQALGLLAGAWGVVRAARTRHGGAMFVLLAAGTALSSPYFYLYDITPVMIGILLLWGAQLQADRGTRRILCGMVLLMVVLYNSRLLMAPAGLILTLLLWVMAYDWLQKTLSLKARA